jgi:hypothetical protein
MDKDKLGALADALLDAKVAALQKEGNQKIKKGKTGTLVFLLLFAFFLGVGIFFAAFHLEVEYGGASHDIHEIGIVLFYVSIPLDLVSLFCVYSYRSLIKEGQKEIAESAKVSR